MARYFIAYDFLTQDDKLGAGNVEFILNERINSSKDIIRIQVRILEDYPNYKAVVVKNYIELIEESKKSITDITQVEKNMAKIKCRWLACQHNTGKADNDEFGMCACEEEIVLNESGVCDECGEKNETLVCCNFISKHRKVNDIK